MLFPAKWRICPRAHPDLCLATIPPGGRSGGWDRSIWEERTPSERSWRASPPTTSSCSEKPSTRGAAATRPAPARSSMPPRLIGRTRGARGAARARKVSGGRIAPGSPLIHHLERVHDALARGARERGAQGRCERPDLPERMEIVNDLCSWLKRYLWRFTGMSPTGTCRPTSTGTSPSSGSTRRATGWTRLQGRCAIS